MTGISSLAAWLRFADLTSRSFWIDEGVSVAIARLDWFNFLCILWRREANMSLYYVLLRAWLHFGHSEAFIRSLSVITAVATVPLLYFLGARLFNRSTGLIAALLLALNAYHVRYAQEARSYSLTVFLLTLSSLLFVILIASPSPRTRRWFIAISGLAVYAHFFAVLVLLAQRLSLQVVRMPEDELARLKRSFIIIACIVAPVMVFIVTTGAGPISWIPRTSGNALYGLAVYLTGFGSNRALWFYFGCLVLFVIFGVREKKLAPENRWSHGFVLLWLFAPLIITVAFSAVRPVLLPRYLIISLPALILAVAAAVAKLRPRFVSTVLVLILIFFSAQGLRAYYAGATDAALEDWRGATQYVLQQAQPGDGVLFHNGMGRMAYDFCACEPQCSPNQPRVIFPTHGESLTYMDFMGQPGIPLLQQIGRSYPRVWVLLSHNQTAHGMDSETVVIEALLSKQYRRMEKKQFSGIEVILYQQEMAATKPEARLFLVAHQHAAASVVVARDFHEGHDYSFARGAGFFHQDVSHAAGNSPLLFGGASFEQSDLNKRH